MFRDFPRDPSWVADISTHQQLSPTVSPASGSSSEASQKAGAVGAFFC